MRSLPNVNRNHIMAGNLHIITGFFFTVKNFVETKPNLSTHIKLMNVFVVDECLEERRVVLSVSSTMAIV